MATFANLILLPSLLISFEKQLGKKALNDSLTFAYDDDDIEVEELKLADNQSNGEKVQRV